MQHTVYKSTRYGVSRIQRVKNCQTTDACLSDLKRYMCKFEDTFRHWSMILYAPFFVIINKIKAVNMNFSYDVTVIQWITSYHKQCYDHMLHNTLSGKK